MERLKIETGVMVVLLLATVAFVSHLPTVEASGTIYIRADGSVDPPTAPIQRVGNIYTFTNNIYDTIEVQRSNIIIDGAGYTITSTPYAWDLEVGIAVYYRNNVTIKNTEVGGCTVGIELRYSSNSKLIGNTIEGIACEIALLESKDNIIYHNNFVHARIYDWSWGNWNYKSSINTWDNGYPSGGNYWSDYAGMDMNGDGIGDTPYGIDFYNRDRYPLMVQWGAVSYDDWPMFHHDSRHTGYSTSKAPNTNNTLWSFTTGSSVVSSPAVVNGKLFVGSSDNKLYALNASTGALIWSYKTGDVIYSSPTVANGRVFFGSYDNNVYALDETTGALIWSTPTEGQIFSSLAVADGKVFIGGGWWNNKIYALNEATGNLVWSYTTGAMLDSSPAVAAGMVFIGTNDGYVLALKETDGSLVWSYNNQYSVTGSPTVADGVVFVQWQGTNVMALNQSTGKLLWSFAPPVTLAGSDDASPAVAYGKVFIGLLDGNVYALDKTTGSKIWNYTTGGEVWSSPAVADGKVFVGSRDKKVYALDATTGAYIWSYTTGDEVWSSPAVAYGEVFVSSSDGKVYAFGLPPIEDPTLDFIETSEYLIGSVAVGIIFVESNGTIDLNTENWTPSEESTVTSKIQYALDWWKRQNPNANVTFVTDINYRVPTSYEPISRNTTEAYLWIGEVMTYLGYPGADWGSQAYNYVNALRDKLRTDWCFAMLIVNAENDEDGRFPDALGVAYANVGGPCIVAPARTDDSLLDGRIAHEMGHIFWATDEYTRPNEYSGYLNVSDVDGSGCLMQTVGSWNLSGKPYGLNGTWGQVGWRDSDTDSIQDIVDTSQRVCLNPYERIGNKLNFTGVAAVTPTENKNPLLRWYKPRRNITINRIQSVQFRIDKGKWVNATMIPTNVRKLVKYPNIYAMKETYAIVNFTFLTPGLTPGIHFIEIKATNQWGNSGYTDQTVEIPPIPSDINRDGIVDIYDVVIVAIAFGSSPGDPNWNPAADINNDNIVDIYDVVIIATAFGTTG